MASVPLVIGNSPVSGPQNNGSDKVAADENYTNNQLDKLSFPQVMKKAKGDSDVKQDDGQTAPIQIASSHDADTVLPLPGMHLPLNLAQGADPDQSDVAISGNPAISLISNGESPAPRALEGGGKGRDGKGVRQSLLPASSRVSSPSQDPQPATGDAASKKSSLMPIADDQAQIVPKSEFNVLLPSAQGYQQTTGALIHDSASGAFEKHIGTVEISTRIGLDAPTGLHGLIQGTDKVHQSFTMPSAIAVPLKTPEWGDEISNRVVWMVQHDVQTASIKINPPHLGPLEVHVSMNKDHVDVSFNSHHVAVKEALDASMPKLREMLGNSGLQLGDANVTHQSFSGQSQYSNQGSGHQYSEDGDKNMGVAIPDNEETVNSSISGMDAGSSAIDFYA